MVTNYNTLDNVMCLFGRCTQSMVIREPNVHKCLQSTSCFKKYSTFLKNLTKTLNFNIVRVHVGMNGGAKHVEVPQF